jgi:hypothetical protein
VDENISRANTLLFIIDLFIILENLVFLTTTGELIYLLVIHMV